MTFFLSPPRLVPQISEKQKSLYEALERQQHYQESLQSISTKMESIEGALGEGLEPNKSPESQMAAHQVGERLHELSCVHVGETKRRGGCLRTDNIKIVKQRGGISLGEYNDEEQRACSGNTGND